MVQGFSQRQQETITPRGEMKMLHNFSGSSEIKLVHLTIDFNMFLPRKVSLGVPLPVLDA